MSYSLQNDETESMPEAAILGALKAIQARIDKARAERVQLDRLIAAAQEEKQLLDRLLALRRGESSKAEVIQSAEGFSQESKHAGGELNHPTVGAVLEELEQAGRPLHISDLMQLLHNRKIPIPGLGVQANLISYLRRDNRLIRPSRGMYGLASWGMEDISSQVRKKRRRRRIRSTARDGGKQ